MASTFTAVMYGGLTTTETLSGSDLAASSQLLHSGFTEQVNLTAASTPDMTTPAYQSYTLSSGAATIDLTTIQLNGNAQTFSGKKLRYIKVKANAGNANPITVAAGSFTGLGNSFSVTLPAGAHFQFYDGGNGTAVSGSVKTLTLSGTGSSDGVQVSACCGD